MHKVSHHGFEQPYLMHHFSDSTTSFKLLTHFSLHCLSHLSTHFVSRADFLHLSEAVDAPSSLPPPPSSASRSEMCVCVWGGGIISHVSLQGLSLPVYLAVSDVTGLTCAGNKTAPNQTSACGHASVHRVFTFMPPIAHVLRCFSLRQSNKQKKKSSKNQCWQGCGAASTVAHVTRCTRRNAPQLAEQNPGGYLQ